MHRARHRAFTLIELLVVIAIIALLIALILPAIGKARKAAQMAISNSNIHQICVAAAAYQDNYKGFLPIVVLRNGRGQIAEAQSNTIQWMCSWTWGGKNCNGWWASNLGGGWMDNEASDRPLTSYLTSNPPFPTDTTTLLSQNAQDRYNFKLPVCRDPSDQFSYQQQWDATQTPNPPWGQIVSRDWQDGTPISAYDDVGTSYQANLKWQEQLYPTYTSDWGRSWFIGMKRLQVADSFSSSRFSWLTDQYADICVYNPDPNFKVRNGYGDYNKSIMGFMDGHGAYKSLIPGHTIQSYRNDDYTFVFEDLRVPH